MRRPKLAAQAEAGHDQRDVRQAAEQGASGWPLVLCRPVRTGLCPSCLTSGAALD